MSGDEYFYFSKTLQKTLSGAPTFYQTYNIYNLRESMAGLIWALNSNGSLELNLHCELIIQVHPIYANLGRPTNLHGH